MPEKPQQERNNGIPLFKIAGIRIMLDYSWFIIFALVTWSLAAGYFPREFPGLPVSSYWIAGVIASILFFFSIILHELMHSIVAMKSGIRIGSITLFIFGGASHLSHEAKTPQNELWIALSGPLTSIVLGLALWGATSVIRGDVSPLIASVFNYLAWINIFLGIFNLVPAFPLDGGRVLRAIVWWKTGNPAYAIRLSTDFGKGFAIAIIVLGAIQIFAGALIAGVWLVLIGLFLRSMAYAGMHEFEISHSMENMKVKNVMIEDLVSVPPDITVDRLITDYLFHTTLREFPVRRDEELLGMVSLDQLARVEKETRSQITVGDIMTPISDNIRISPEEMLSEALQKMNTGNVNRLLVMNDGRLVGIITKSGVLRLLELKSG
ncbi:MAG: site-2 protease family protein [Candidatus Latescibacterota bacterium]